MYKHLLAALLLLNCFAAQAQRLTDMATYLYNANSSSYYLYDSSHNTYSGNRYTTPDMPENYDTSYFIERVQGTMVARSSRLQLFDAHDNVIHLANGYLNNNSWTYGGGQYFTYDANNNMLSDTQYAANVGLGTWRLNELNLYTYNATNKVLAHYELDWETATNTWDSTTRANYTYNTADYLISRKLYVWDNSGPILDNSFDYSYNSANLCNAIIFRRYTGSSWNDESAQFFEYNAHNDISIQYDVKYNSPFFPNDSMVTIHYYNSANQLTGTVRQHKNTAWDNIDSTTFIYNIDGTLDSQKFTYWGASGWEPPQGSLITKCYYEPFTPNAVAQLPQQGGTLQLYPVPANNTLYLQINEEKQQLHTLSITDMRGRQVMQQTYFGNTMRSIDISTLPAGIYNLSLLSTKGGMQHSKFSVVR